MDPTSGGRSAALVPSSEPAVGANASALIAALEPLRPQSVNPAANTDDLHISYLSSNFAQYPTGGPTLGAFLSYVHPGTDAPQSDVLLDYGGLSSFSHRAVNWLGASSLAAGGVLLDSYSLPSHGWVHGNQLAGGPNIAEGPHSHSPNRTEGLHNLTGIFCDMPGGDAPGFNGNGASGNTRPCFFLGVLVIILLIADLYGCCGFRAHKFIAKFVREDPTGSTGEPVASSVEETGTEDKLSTTVAHETPKDAAGGKLGAAPEGKGDEKPAEDDMASPTTITWQSWMIICFTIVPVRHLPPPPPSPPRPAPRISAYHSPAPPPPDPPPLTPRALHPAPYPPASYPLASYPPPPPPCSHSLVTSTSRCLRLSCRAPPSSTV